MRYTGILIACLCILALVNFGCAYIPLDFAGRDAHPGGGSRLIELNYNAAEILSRELEKNRIEEDPMLISTFVNLDNVHSASSLGRLIPQQISSRLTQLGYNPLDVRLRDRDILIRERKGEIALSRRLEDLSLQQQGRTILVGTYSLFQSRMYVTVKVLRCRDSATLAAHDYVLPLEKDEGVTSTVEPSVVTDYM
ncbi:MAG: FlgO family outer membrane protein [Thermodesulfobacteriota bacterium]